MKKNIFLGIAFVAFLAACTDDLGENKVQNPVQVGDEILFGSTISDDANVIESRTVYGDRTDTGIPVYWKEEGDLVAIFCPQASQPANKLVNYLVKPQMGTDGKPTNGSASVTAQVNPGEAGLQWGNAETHRFYAFYPAKSVKGTGDDGKIKSNIPVEQNVAKWRMGSDINGVTTHFGLPNMDLAYMYACDSVVTANMDKGTPINLKFHNLLTVLDITIPGPKTGSDPITVTAINVEAVSDDGQEGHEPILTGDFYCYLRDGIEGHKIGDCEPVNPEPTEVSNRIAISTYDPDAKEFIKVAPGEQINVKAYILPHTDAVIAKQSLKISVVTMNGAPKTKTLQKREIEPGKVNRVRLPYLEQSNETNYWMSNLDPNVYFTELSLPGSHQSVGLSDEGSYEKYQTQSLEQQFRDGIRAFSFQTVYHNYIWLVQDEHVNVFASGGEKDELYTYLKQLADVIETMKTEKPDNKEFVLVSLVWKSYRLSTNLNEWCKVLSNQLNNIDKYKVLPIYRGEINANTTINDLAGTIVLRIDRPSTYDMPGLVSACPSDRIDGTVGIVEYPMQWQNANNSQVLTLYAHDGTSIDVSGNSSGEIANMTTKLGYVEDIFKKSVDLYHNNTDHNYFYHTNIGGFYCLSNSSQSLGGKTIQYTKDIMPSVVDYVQTRGEDASLGVVLMNFADKQPGSGADYGCDGLIQTIIYNNFSFALRKKTSGTTPAASYNASYRSGGNAVGWDE